MKRVLSVCLALSLCAAMTACGQTGAEKAGTVSSEKWEDAAVIQLSDNGITVDGEAVSTDETAAVYTANDIVYYESGKDFTYGEGSETDAHSQEEADAHTVLHITEAGRYVLRGTLSAGQIAVDLGEDAEEDPSAVVTLILDGVDITCSVAPAVIFYHVYECGSTEAADAGKDVDTTNAGANVIIGDGSVNNITGSYVARIYKPDSVELSEDGTEVADAKKLHKYDAAFYSKMSMNVDGDAEGTGVLNIIAENEGLDSELHLTINGGNIDILSGNDGINTNEDGISVTPINGGSLTITVDGSTGEGDGIDSNGWLVINGGTVAAYACSDSGDSGIDSDMGIHINGGTVIASGNMLDRIEAGGQNYAVFNFAERQPGGTEITLKTGDGQVFGSYAPVNDYSILLVSSPDLAAGDYTLWQGDTQLAGSTGGGMGGGMMGDPGMGGMMGGPGMGGGSRPEGMTPPEGMTLPENGQEPPEGMEMPEMTQNAEPPEQPEGMERPEGEPGQKPAQNADGTMTPPDGSAMDPSELTPPENGGGQRPGGGMGGPGRGEGGMGGGAASTVFTITDGGTQFSRVAAAE